MQDSIYSAEKEVQQMSGRVQREQEDLQRRASALAETGLKQEAEAQRLQLERRSWQDGEAERSRLDAAARESKQQAQHLKVPRLCCSYSLQGSCWYLSQLPTVLQLQRLFILDSCGPACGC